MRERAEGRGNSAEPWVIASSDTEQRGENVGFESADSTCRNIYVHTVGGHEDEMVECQKGVLYRPR